MGVTRFPDGVNVGNDAAATATFQIGGTAVTPLSYPSLGKKIVAGTVTVPSGSGGTAFTVTGVTTIDYLSVAPYSTVVTVAGFNGVVGSHAGGTVTLYGVSGAGTVSTSDGTATYLVVGS